jgi:hypothetical protein
MRSTVGMVEEFSENKVWQDMVELFGIWLEDIRDQLEDPSGLTTDKVLARLAGNAEALRRCMHAPEWLINHLEGKEQEDG